MSYCRLETVPRLRALHPITAPAATATPPGPAPRLRRSKHPPTTPPQASHPPRHDASQVTSSPRPKNSLRASPPASPKARVTSQVTSPPHRKDSPQASLANGALGSSTVTSAALTHDRSALPKGLSSASPARSDGEVRATAGRKPPAVRPSPPRGMQPNTHRHGTTVEPAPAHDAGGPSLAERYRAVLESPAPMPPPPRTRASSAGKVWAADAHAAASHWARADAILQSLGIDAATCEPLDLRKCVSSLRDSGELDKAVHAAQIRAATDPDSAAPGGWMATSLASTPIVWLSRSWANGLCPVAVLTHLRMPGIAWRSVLAIAVLGAPAPIRELARPTATSQNHVRGGPRLAPMRALVNRDVANGWLRKMPGELLAPSLRSNAPLSVVLKSDGVSYRLIADDTNRQRGMSLGANAAMDLASLPFPTADRPVPVIQLAGAMAASGATLRLAGLDLSVAFKRITNSACAQVLLNVVSQGVRYATVACSMGSSHSSSALNTVTCVVAQALSSGGCQCRAYCDDLILLSTSPPAQASAWLSTVVATLACLGLPTSEAKTTPFGPRLTWTGIEFIATAKGVSVLPSEKMRASLGSDLSSIASRSPRDRTVATALIGRLYWFASLVPAFSAFARDLLKDLAACVSGSPARRWSFPAAASARVLLPLLGLFASPIPGEYITRALAPPDPHPAGLFVLDASGDGCGIVLCDLARAAKSLRPGPRQTSTVPCEAWWHRWAEHTPQSVLSETRALAIAVHIATVRFPGKTVRILSDSTSAIAVGNRTTAPLASSYANTLVADMAERLLTTRTVISCMHIQGKLNVVADLLSRSFERAQIQPSWPLGMQTLGTAVAGCLRTSEASSLQPFASPTRLPSIFARF